MINAEPTIADLQEFHARHKYILMSHDQNSVKSLGKLVASYDGKNLGQLITEYLTELMIALKKVATPKNHCNTLQHLQGY